MQDTAKEVLQSWMDGGIDEIAMRHNTIVVTYEDGESLMEE